MSARSRDVLLGLVYVGCCLSVVIAAALVYQGTFSRDITVTVHAQEVGNALRPGSDVKFQGVPVGTVNRIRSFRTGATLELNIDRERAGLIPGDSQVQMLPQTLFGERYVAIVHQSSSGPTLQDGDVLTQDTSDRALQVEHLFDSLMPVLTAVQPEKLNATLGELAAALQGRGDKIGDAMLTWAAYMREINPHLPTLTRDLALFAETATAYAQAVPDMLAALDDLATTGETIVEYQQQLRDLFTSVTGAGAATDKWLEPNSGTVIKLAADSRKVLAVMARYAPEFPCLASTFSKLIPDVNKRLLGKGSGEPGIHADVKVVGHRSRFRSGLQLQTGGRPVCPNGSGGVKPASRVNTAEESLVVNEILALRQSASPSDYPAWSSLLVGPVLRDAEVSLR